jgi:hypothetical protein
MNSSTSGRREYLRAYQREWIRNRRDYWIAANGPCAQCNSDKDLEVDHVDSSQKEITPALLWSLAPDNPKRIAELAKCQVLCKECHAAKTRRENSARSTGTSAKIAALDDKGLADVRARLARGDRECDIARDKNVSKYVISRVKRGEAYKEKPVPDQPGSREASADREDDW